MTDGTDRKHLLTDEQVMDFVISGYHLLELPQERGFHERIARACDGFERNPGNAIYEAIPELREVYQSPELKGALTSLLGPDYGMNPHRHLHTIRPGKLTSQSWHQDGTNVRDHQVWTVLAMYYPQDVTADMGPTAVLPGSHFRNAPTDRMVNYTNIRGTAFLTVKAGTVAITHFDLWHAGTLNQSSKIRHMLKFLFDRQSEPTSPSWNHDPERGHKIAAGMVSKQVGPPIGYCSDYYKEWELRKEMWNWLAGRDSFVPPGNFRNILNENGFEPTRRKTLPAKH